MDQQAPPREKIFNIPGVVLALIVIFAAIHLLGIYVLTPDQDAGFLSLFAFVPGRFTYAFDPIAVSDVFSRLPRGEAADAAQFFLGDGVPQPWTILTYAFLHADWVHFGVNSVWLAAFGAPVARRFGTWRFLAFMAITAIAGAGVHYLFHRNDLEPVIGASAAISGTMAAAIRFVFVPGAPLDATLGFGARADDRAYQQRALPLLRVLTDRRAMAFFIIWFVVNFIFGAASVPLGITQWAVAWQAHVGGFLAGLLLFPFFDPPRQYSDVKAPSTEAELQDPYTPH
ncbi:MAG TPA: rhomboid family intramembrane serine protease [Beijerinckiaceae bacterium]|nr:rhomboid family intramembrane serine protease [Beijerinckiaceae bacterium]